MGDKLSQCDQNEPFISVGKEIHQGDAACLVLLASLLDAAPSEVLSIGLDGLTRAMRAILEHENQFLVDIAGLVVLFLHLLTRSPVNRRRTFSCRSLD